MADYILDIGHDHDAECPMDWDGSWKLVSFRDRSIHHANPDNYVKLHVGNTIIPATLGLRNKARVGFCFLLDYFEHGSARYDIHGHGPQCRWDTSNYAGMLIWEHPPKDMGSKTFEERQKDAKAFLETYNQWMNGEVYGFNLDKVDGTFVDGCWGFFDAPGMSEHIHPNLKPGDRVQLTGEAAYFYEGKLPPGVEMVEDIAR